jgi:hypothetical protein
MSRPEHEPPVVLVTAAIACAIASLVIVLCLRVLFP